MGASASPGYDGPKVNKDYEIMKLRKRIEKFECENELLKISGPSRAKAMRQALNPETFCKVNGPHCAAAILNFLSQRFLF